MMAEQDLREEMETAILDLAEEEKVTQNTARRLRDPTSSFHNDLRESERNLKDHYENQWQKPYPVEPRQ